MSENEEDEVFLYRLFKVMLNIEKKTPQCLSLALLKRTTIRTEEQACFAVVRIDHNPNIAG